MYSYKTINGKGYVIHNESGCSLPYHSKASKTWRNEELPFWKYEYFKPWLEEYSKNQRMKVKNMFKLAPLPQAVPCNCPVDDTYCKKEGKNPMRYNDNYATANACVSTPKSDAAVTRDYLLLRLDNAECSKARKLPDTFNLYVDNSPKTYKELIDVIKNGKYTIDPKIESKLALIEEDDEDGFSFNHAGPFYGIIWDGLKADVPGSQQAHKDLKVQFTKAKDQIMVGDGVAGLAALEAFEAWQPTTTTTTAS